ncbi:sulfite exporter TauE/SafE family protein [Fulvivirga ulvae]|uniref:sulfite exporter TauE/SafE family protein n=1 Tax=Fulvivirga ulvae TaxID=2904245 RepID=UPI001F3CBAED|nr:sulfite exporter TauE/SafE family protein [Fulvivirga ulvae]UII33425.1 sulfite exporter TauE/SafE family protein [Fulvivirga ulvae]
MIYILLSLAGLVGGFIAGLTGIGTGFLMIVVIPLALQYMDMPETEMVRFTIANTIFATMCSAFVNNLTMLRKKQVYLKGMLWVTIAAVISASLVLHFFVLREEYSKDTYNFIIIIFLAYIIYRTIYKLRKPFHYDEVRSKSKLTLTGITAGVVSSVTGLGGGSIIIPMLNLWLKMDIKKAKSISFGAIFGISFMLTIINLLNTPSSSVPFAHLGYILLPIAIPLSIGVIIASPLGTSLSDRLSSRTISIVFIIVISLVLLRKIFELWG